MIKNDIDKNYEGFDNLKEITSMLSHRMAGTENGKKAEEFIYNKLISYGFEVRYDPFKMNLWKRKIINLSISSHNSIEPMDSVSFAYTPLFSDVKAEIYDVGDGLEQDFKTHGPKLKGKIVLVNLFFLEPKFDEEGEKIGNPHRSMKADWAYKKGALGIIFVNKYEGSVLSTGTVSTNNKKLTKIPSVCISIENGRKIRSYLERGEFVEAHIQVLNEVEKVEARNIIGRITGLEKPDERVIIGGHLDTWDLGQGAIDNGIGSFAILDIARIFKNNYIFPMRTVEFIFWMGEEHGLIGSKHFVKNEIEKGTIGRIKYYLNIDMQGDPKGYDIEGRDEMSGYFTEVGNIVRSVDNDFLNMQKSKPTMGAYSDDLIFSLQGIPILQQMTGLKEKVYQYYHSNRDNFNLVDENHMKKSSLVMAVALYKIANERFIGTPVFTIEETRQFFLDNGGPAVLTPEFNWDLRLSKGVSE